MIYYALLFISSLLVLVLAIAIFRKTRQAGFVLGFGFIYYWTLYGAWLIVSSRLGYGHNYKFDYLFYKLFPIYLDEDYLWSLVLYTFFIVVAQATVLYWAKRPVTSAAQVDRPIYVAHSKILAMSAIAGLGAFALIRNALRTAVTYGVNGYAIIAANQSD